MKHKLYLEIQNEPVLLKGKWISNPERVERMTRKSWKVRSECHMETNNPACNRTGHGLLHTIRLEGRLTSQERT
jgi:hypothetical protein